MGESKEVAVQKRVKKVLSTVPKKKENMQILRRFKEENSLDHSQALDAVVDKPLFLITRIINREFYPDIGEEDTWDTGKETKKRKQDGEKTDTDEDEQVEEQLEHSWYP